MLLIGGHKMCQILVVALTSASEDVTDDDDIGKEKKI